MLFQKKVISEHITEDMEISSDSDREDFYKKILMKKALMKKALMKKTSIECE